MKPSLRIPSNSCNPCSAECFSYKHSKTLSFMHRVKTCSDVPNTFVNKFTYLPRDTQQILEKQLPINQISNLQIKI